MSFDDRIRDSLDTAAQSHVAGAPPVEQLAARVRRRRRARIAMLSGAGALLVAVTIFAAASGGNPTKPVRLTQSPDQGSANATVVGGANETTTTQADQPTPSDASPQTTTTVHPNPSTSRPSDTTATTTPPSSDFTRANADDNGKTFTMHRGERLFVELQPESGWVWSEPDTDNASVLLRTEHRQSTTGYSAAIFLAQTTGQAHVTAFEDARCRQSQPACMVPTKSYEITINVAT
jgi:hypothetical protein